VRYASLGRWMYHCNILEHAEGGMMGELAVQ
jgi:FtsP/CotA-like multicopper oxidase with cupredoxin domain